MITLKAFMPSRRLIPMVALLVGATAAVTTIHESTDAAPQTVRQTASVPVDPGPNNTVPTVSSRAAAIAMATGDSVHLRSVTRTAAKKMHVADLINSSSAFSNGGTDPSSWQNASQGPRLIWVVAVAGDFVPEVPGLPQGQPVPHYASTTYVIGTGPDGGTPIAALHAGVEAWPPFFDALPDIAAG